MIVMQNKKLMKASKQFRLLLQQMEDTPHSQWLSEGGIELSYTVLFSLTQIKFCAFKLPYSTNVLTISGLLAPDLQVKGSIPDGTIVKVGKNMYHDISMSLRMTHIYEDTNLNVNLVWFGLQTNREDILPSTEHVNVVNVFVVDGIKQITGKMSVFTPIKDFALGPNYQYVLAKTSDELMCRESVMGDDLKFLVTSAASNIFKTLFTCELPMIPTNVLLAQLAGMKMENLNDEQIFEALDDKMDEQSVDSAIGGDSDAKDFIPHDTSATVLDEEVFFAEEELTRDYGPADHSISSEGDSDVDESQTHNEQNSPHAILIGIQILMSVTSKPDNDLDHVSTGAECHDRHSYQHDNKETELRSGRREKENDSKAQGRDGAVWPRRGRKRDLNTKVGAVRWGEKGDLGTQDGAVRWGEKGDLGTQDGDVEVGRERRPWHSRWRVEVGRKGDFGTQDGTLSWEEKGDLGTQDGSVRWEEKGDLGTQDSPLRWEEKGDLGTQDGVMKWGRERVEGVVLWDCRVMTRTGDLSWEPVTFIPLRSASDRGEGFVGTTRASLLLTQCWTGRGGSKSYSAVQDGALFVMGVRAVQHRVGIVSSVPLRCAHSPGDSLGSDRKRGFPSLPILVAVPRQRSESEVDYQKETTPADLVLDAQEKKPEMSLHPDKVYTHHTPETEREQLKYKSHDWFTKEGRMSERRFCTAVFPKADVGSWLSEYYITCMPRVKWKDGGIGPDVVMAVDSAVLTRTGGRVIDYNLQYHSENEDEEIIAEQLAAKHPDIRRTKNDDYAILNIEVIRDNALKHMYEVFFEDTQRGYFIILIRGLKVNIYQGLKLLVAICYNTLFSVSSPDSLESSSEVKVQFCQVRSKPASGLWIEYHRSSEVNSATCFHKSSPLDEWIGRPTSCQKYHSDVLKEQDSWLCRVQGLKPILWNGGMEGERRGMALQPTKVSFRADKNR
uniref:Uncharacterized protein n=1 Tax=Timema monikensis TaxID=170555 RepID=A0A7R9DWX8_9NEOP|nr:unnamed protein product [Timema monikensis]